MSIWPTRLSEFLIRSYDSMTVAEDRIVLCDRAGGSCAVYLREGIAWRLARVEGFSEREPSAISSCQQRE